MPTPTAIRVTPTDMQSVLGTGYFTGCPHRLNDIEEGVLRAAKERVRAARSEDELVAAARNLDAVRHMVVGWVLSREAAAARRATRAG